MKIFLIKLDVAVLLLISVSGYAASINVDVSSPVVTIPETMFGGNLAQYEGTGDDFGQPQYTGGIQAYKAAGLHNIRIPGGIWADKWQWSYVASGPDAWMVDVFEMLQNITDMGGNATPQCIVNYSGAWRDVPGGADVMHSRAATIQLAADWVTYMNVTNAYNVKYWEVGNEDFGAWHPHTALGSTYGNEFADFYNAMKAVDPTIMIGMQIAVESAYQTWSQDAMNAAKARGVFPDFFVVHHYKDNDILGQSVNDATDFTVMFNGWVNSIYGAAFVPQAKYFMTEFRTRGQYGTVGDNRYRNSYMDAMFTLQYLMELAQQGWEGANIWANKLIYNAGPPITDYGIVERNTNDPYAVWYMYSYMTAYMGRQMVQTTDDLGDTVRAYGTLNASGDLVIAVVNNSETVAQNVTMNITGGSVNGTNGELFEFQPIGTTTMGLTTPANLRMQLSINGVNDPTVAAIASLPAQVIPVAQSFSLTIPVNGIQFIKVPLNPIYSPTPTLVVSPTPSFTVSPTVTATPTGIPSNPADRIEDLEDGNNQILLQGGRNGFWFSSGGGAIIYNAPGDNSTNAASYVLAAPGGNGLLAFNLTGPPGPYDASAYQGVRMRIKAAVGTQSNIDIQVRDNLGINAVQSIVATSVWQTFEIYFSINPAMDVTQVRQIRLAFTNSLPWDIQWDNIEFIPVVAATPSYTKTPSQTATANFTGTRTPTDMRTASPSATVTLSVSSPTQTSTEVPSATATLSVSSPTRTSTEVPSATVTASPSVVVTMTASLSSSITVSPTLSYSVSATSTPGVGTKTATSSRSPSVTAVNTLTLTETLSSTKTSSSTPTMLVASVTATGTVTQTLTPLLNTFTSTPSVTASLSQTPLFVQTVLEKDGPLFITEALTAPNPVMNGSGVIMFKLSASADEVRIKIYTTGMLLVGSLNGGPFGDGWSRIELGDKIYHGLSAGLYYYSVRAFRAKAQSTRVVGKIYIER